ncbi:hypothetical protein MP228_009453 [Amoeboaphelidium protococcarum]|nr:hypothetical protein MP228_009453 [Amoeboaphelidium protococcarum]
MLRQIVSKRLISQSLIKRGGGGGHHYKGYNEPGGHFLDIPPTPAGYRRKKLWFENMYVYGFGGTWLAFFVFYYYKPEPEIESWARYEAMLRAKERGENWSTEGKPY